MNLFEEIKSKLKDVSDIETIEEDRCFSVILKASNSFDVSLHIDEEEYTVCFGDGWHEHFSSEEEALRCFFYGLTDKYRMKILIRGGKPYRWIVETFDEGNWEFVSSTGLLFFPFWRKKEVKILQNNVL